MTSPTPEVDPVAMVRALGGYALNEKILTDAEIRTYLGLAPSGNYRIAAADALQAVAASTVLISKVIRTQDLQTNGAAEADALRRLAGDLRAQGQAEISDADDDGFGFTIASGQPGSHRPEHTNFEQTEFWGL